jgi:hypothetical protein
MNSKDILEVKKKREFSDLPDTIVERALKDSKGDIKQARAFLRKYFGVFLTNKVIKGIGEEVLESHISSRKRDYDIFYKSIFDIIGKNFRCVFDLGCGVNGFSYFYLRKYLGGVKYLGIEASGQLVDNMNSFFKAEGFDASAIKEDLMDLDSLKPIFKKCSGKKVAFLFQLVDALENLEKNFSKKFILEVSKGCKVIVLTLPVESLSGKTRFEVNRKWIVDFLEENFEILGDFKLFGERILCLKTNN